MPKLSPISLFVYNRLNFLKQTVDALAANTLAAESDLIIFSDGAKENATEKDLLKITEVRTYVNSIKGFKSITIIENKVNKGLANSIVDGVTAVIQKHGKTIVLEDDLVTSPFFLKYMNEALDIYEHKPEVICIHAYTYAAKHPDELPETFFLRGADCLGWATWKRGWDLFNPDAQFLYDKLKQEDLLTDFNYNNNYDFSGMLQETALKNHSWAIKWYASAYLANKLTLYPKTQLLKHIGLVGTNCNTDNQDVFSTEIYDKPIVYFENKLIENKKARNQIAFSFKNNTSDNLLITHTKPGGLTLPKLKYFVNNLLFKKK